VLAEQPRRGGPVVGIEAPLGDLHQRRAVAVGEQVPALDDPHVVIAPHRGEVAPLLERAPERRLPGAPCVQPPPQRGQHEPVDVDGVGDDRRCVGRRRLDDLPTVGRVERAQERVLRVGEVRRPHRPDGARRGIPLVDGAVVGPDPESGVPHLRPPVAGHQAGRVRPAQPGVRREGQPPRELDRGLEGAGLADLGDGRTEHQLARRLRVGLAGRHRHEPRFQGRPGEQRLERVGDGLEVGGDGERQPGFAGEPVVDRWGAEGLARGVVRVVVPELARLRLVGEGPLRERLGGEDDREVGGGVGVPADQRRPGRVRDEPEVEELEPQVEQVLAATHRRDQVGWRRDGGEADRRCRLGLAPQQEQRRHPETGDHGDPAPEHLSAAEHVRRRLLVASHRNTLRPTGRASPRTGPIEPS
jgi:hypothetical protein